MSRESAFNLEGLLNHVVRIELFGGGGSIKVCPIISKSLVLGTLAGYDALSNVVLLKAQEYGNASTISTRVSFNHD